MTSDRDAYDYNDGLIRAYAAGVISLNEMRVRMGYDELDGGDEIPALRKMEELTVLEEGEGTRWHEVKPGIVSTKKVGQSYRIFFDRSEIEALNLEVGDIVQVEATVVSKAPVPGVNEATIQKVVDAAKRKLTMVEVRANQSGDITMDDVIALVYGVSSDYRKNACFLINDKTALALRKLKDGKGSYLWQPVPGKGMETLMGYPVYSSSLVPEIPPTNKTGIAAIFGDIDAFLECDEKEAIAKLTVPKRIMDKLGGAGI